LPDGPKSPGGGTAGDSSLRTLGLGAFSRGPRGGGPGGDPKSAWGNPGGGPLRPVASPPARRRPPQDPAHQGTGPVVLHDSSTGFAAGGLDRVIRPEPPGAFVSTAKQPAAKRKIRRPPSTVARAIWNLMGGFFRLPGDRPPTHPSMSKPGWGGPKSPDHKPPTVGVVVMETAQVHSEGGRQPGAGRRPRPVLFGGDPGGGAGGGGGPNPGFVGGGGGPPHYRGFGGRGIGRNCTRDMFPFRGGGDPKGRHGLRVMACRFWAGLGPEGRGKTKTRGAVVHHPRDREPGPPFRRGQTGGGPTSVPPRGNHGFSGGSGR